MPTEKKLKKFSRQLDRAEGKLSRISYKAGKKEAKVIKKTENKAAKAGIKLKTGYLPSVKKTLREDGKWPVKINAKGGTLMPPKPKREPAKMPTKYIKSFKKK